MSNPYVKMSVERIQKLLASEANYENASDIIADILHYCEANGTPFQVALERAQDYHAADVGGYDEEPLTKGKEP